ncbi:hypothetical protein EVAR_76604_1 [Eumeta japonica]|uniref:Uncharacterized protein n=1 Tax=Eumeta variegata TaxID=151549 RepID=A0A4C1T5E2_EUMVA|nr:hypothetical protein EVAR_76604_1 [Eumeta japonica]
MELERPYSKRAFTAAQNDQTGPVLPTAGQSQARSSEKTARIDQQKRYDFFLTFRREVTQDTDAIASRPTLFIRTHLVAVPRTSADILLGAWRDACSQI